MIPIINIPPPGNSKRVVIIGGGFAGLELARKINKKYYQVVLIDKNNYHQFQPLLYQVATGGLEPSSICYPLRKTFQKYKNFHFRMCEAKQVHTDEKRLETDIGNVYYDYLVIATGCDTNFFGNDRLKESTFSLKSTSESILLRNRILLSFERAANITDVEELKKMLNFTIVGAGATGVELAGSLADMKKTILPNDYPEIDFNNMEIHLVDGASRVLSAMSESASKSAQSILRKRGVNIHLGVMVTDYNRPVLTLNDNTELYSHNVLWVGGVKANNILGLQESAYIKGKLSINEYNVVDGYDDIYALGDTSLLVTNGYAKGHPQVAQVALQMAKQLADNLNRQIKGRKPKRFVYTDKGSLAIIGRNAAVADIGKLHFGGFIAWWIWLFIHIISMIGIRNRLSVLINWAWSYLNYGVSLRIIIRPEKNKIFEDK